MTCVAFASAKGSPGVTACIAALALGWPSDRQLLVCDLDAAGGDIAAWLELPASPSIATLAAESRHGLNFDVVLDHSHEISDGRRVLGGGSGAEEAAVALDLLHRGQLAPILAAARDWDVLLDLGRLDATAARSGVLDAVDELIVVARPTWSHIRHVAGRIRGWRRETAVRMLLVGDRPYSAIEVADALEVDVVGVLADDAVAAGALCGARVLTRGFERSRLGRSARALVEQLTRDDLVPGQEPDAVEEVA